MWLFEILCCVSEQCIIQVGHVAAGAMRALHGINLNDLYNNKKTLYLNGLYNNKKTLYLNGHHHALPFVDIKLSQRTVSCYALLL